MCSLSISLISWRSEAQPGTTKVSYGEGVTKDSDRSSSS
jgi:hypothetical protein